MKVCIADKAYLTGLTEAEKTHIQRELTFTNPKYTEAVRFNRSVRGIDKTIPLSDWVNDTLIIPRGVSLPALGLNEAPLQDERHSYPVSFPSQINPRSYQERALRLAMTSQGGVIVGPTGSGKTTIGIELAARLGERCLILVKSKDLALQWIGAIKKFTGLECGLIGDGKWSEGEQFTVATVQTLVKYEVSLDYGLVIVDECHNVPAMQAYTVINHQKAKYRFGLSATPQRRDNLEFMIHAALGPIVAEIEQHEVEGAVLPVSIATLDYRFRGKSETWTQFVNDLAADSERNRLIVSRAVKSSRTIGTAVLTGTIAHAETLYNLIREQGVDALLLHGQLPKKIRDDRMAAAGSSPLIIGTLSLLSEGIDWPHIGAIIFASPVSAAVDKETPAATRLIQSIGRARRPFPGKSVAYVLDIIDSHPFGKAAYRKRGEIYRQQGFAVRSLNAGGYA
jgi:superfamily II DNA or RNA helicase